MNDKALRVPVALEGELAARAALAHLVERRTWVFVLLAVVGSCAVALFERRQAELGAADRALSGAGLGVALPLVAYVVSDAAMARRRLRVFLEPLSRHGANPSSAAAALIAALCVVLAVCGAAIALFTTFCARGFGAGLVQDLFASAWTFGLGGATYAGYFALASTFGKQGGGRKWLLALDFLFGVSGGALAVPWPRSHLRNVVGGAPVLGMSQGMSALALLALGCLTAYFAIRRART